MHEQFNWKDCAGNLTLQQTRNLAAERAVAELTINGLRDRSLLGSCYVEKEKARCLCFPICDQSGNVYRAHCRSVKRNGDGKWQWSYEPQADPQARPITALVFGNPDTATKRYIFESQWDAISGIDKLDLFEEIDSGETCLIMTRGADFGDRLKVFTWPSATTAGGIAVYAFPQNDSAGRKWLANVLTATGGAYVVEIPSPYKDLGDWVKDGGATAYDIEGAMECANFEKPAAEAKHVCPPVEFVENVEIESERIDFEEVNSTSSTNSGRGHTQTAIFPQDSILKEFYDYAVTITEGADCYVIGSILPVCAALLGRSVWLPWTYGSLHCNLFSICVGKPSDRKTTTIGISGKLARECLPNEAFIPKAFSPETLFDEYDPASGGQNDKILIADDANSILTDWKRSGNGERNATQFLDLYDCKNLSESYRRNRKKGSTEGQRRYIEFTSTSVVFGATFNICRFQNHVIQAGLQRRFLYYVAEDFGRTILYPKDDPKTFKDLVEKFSILKGFSGPFRFATAARALFELFQQDNRFRHSNANPFDDALLCRLGSIPTATLKVAQIFEACRSVYAGTLGLMIQKETLQLAIDHVEECSIAAGRLEVIADRQNTINDAEILLATVRCEYVAIARNGSIILSRTELTRRFAANGKRGLTVDDLYLRLIPHLIQTGQAKALPKKGKLERYAFQIES